VNPIQERGRREEGTDVGLYIDPLHLAVCALAGTADRDANYARQVWGELVVWTFNGGGPAFYRGVYVTHEVTDWVRTCGPTWS
jgi:hypothetical protein